ncbi:tol-pal system protein YbgF [Crenobacter sp. SG2303]|uniref:Cell division coordinator CpoB n=1 Tax=Crenobacter oryzisoli TaxID=3056844 RepID=A0ABT7XJG1_9NEIS|nr:MULTISPECIES: tol-pal system protein YbgF [unclassified Crenobacter]MDN0073927.1 tol-pal system protein YbgF [Crenobacter sp. SG2303]MDN0083506.1 tol-pal system protein YbgF [Crenobacter sp. SG2305]
MKAAVSAVLLASLLAGCATTSDIEDTRRQIDTVNKQAQTRLSTIESKLSNEKLLEMVSQVESLKAEVAKLRGESEVMNYNLQTTQKRQNDLYNDLDSRVAKLEGHAPAAAGGATGASADGGSGSAANAGSNAGTAQASPDYDKAIGLLRNRDFEKAVGALKGFIDANPTSPQVPDATYWLGVAHTALRQYDAAIEIHRRFVEQYPSNPKAPDALRNVANCQRDLDQIDVAKNTLRRLIKLYPSSAAAVKAKEQLKHM